MPPVDDKLRQLTELEIHFHRWTLYELGLPAVIVRYVDMVMKKRLLMALKMSAAELQQARVTGTGPWQSSTAKFVHETFTEDDLTEIVGLEDTLRALRDV